MPSKSYISVTVCPRLALTNIESRVNVNAIDEKRNPLTDIEILLGRNFPGMYASGEVRRASEEEHLVRLAHYRAEGGPRQGGRATIGLPPGIAEGIGVYDSLPDPAARLC